MKPSWDNYFFDIMNSVASRATCDRGRSGCIIVRDNRIISTGYVGSPAGMAECDDVGHEMEARAILSADPKNKEELMNKLQDVIASGNVSFHCIRTIHAEMNAILYAARFGIALGNAELYCRMTPCRRCTEAIISVGIQTVHCERIYQKSGESEHMFREAGISFDYKFNEVQKY